MLSHRLGTQQREGAARIFSFEILNKTSCKSYGIYGYLQGSLENLAYAEASNAGAL
jgi:hypothetical protein